MIYCQIDVGQQVQFPSLVLQHYALLEHVDLCNSCNNINTLPQPPIWFWPRDSCRDRPWKTKVVETKAFSAHLRRFFAQTKPLAFGRK
jgi:hypothetical protein